MARRLCFSRQQLQRECVGFCDNDPRVLVKDGDEWNISLRTFNYVADPRSFSQDVRIDARNTRQLRLIARQLEMLAAWFEREGLVDVDTEVRP